MEKTIFQQMNDNEIPVERLYDGKTFFVINDINPVAPMHRLIIPKRKAKNFTELSSWGEKALGEFFSEVSTYLRDNPGEDPGFRMIINIGEMGGQTVDYLHFHVIGGKDLRKAKGPTATTN